MIVTLHTYSLFSVLVFEEHLGIYFLSLSHIFILNL